MSDNFAAAVAGWTEKTEALQTDVLHQSVRQLVDETTTAKDAGGHMPVLTGNLRNSVAVSALAPITFDFRTKKFRNPADAVNNAIAGIEVGKPAWVGFRAPYAHKIEVDSGFLRLPAQRWAQIVDEAVRVSKGRAGR